MANEGQECADWTKDGHLWWVVPLGLYLAGWLGAASYASIDYAQRVLPTWPVASRGAQASPSPASSASPAPASSGSPSPASSGSPSPTPSPKPSPSASPSAAGAVDNEPLHRALNQPWLLWWLGCLGASVSAMWAYARRLGERPTAPDCLTVHWIPYYLVRPPMGGVFGLMSVIGLEFLQFRPVSPVPLLFLAFAAGLVSRQASLKLREVALSFFTSREYIEEKRK